MKVDFAEKIVDMMQNYGVEAEFRSDYSGRGMFGKTTGGIVTSMKNAALVGYYAALVVGETCPNVDERFETIEDFDAMNNLPRYCDTMGLDVIFY